MVATALTANSGERVRFTAVGAHASGDILQLPDGSAGVVDTAKTFATGDLNAGAVRCGRFSVLKTASMVFLAGSRVYYDRSTGLATLLKGVGRFEIGTVVADAAASAERVDVYLNGKQHNIIELGDWDKGGGWSTSDALGLGTVITEGLVTLAMDAVAEIALASLLGNQGVDVDDGPILEMDLAIYDVGDNAALDINFGLATEAHASDFDSSAAYLALHLDGSNLSLLLQSDDGTTPVTATDSTVDAVDDTFALYQFDLRDKSDIKIYKDGVLLTGATLHLNAFSGTLYPVVHLEKTSDNTTADVRVRAIRCRTTDVSVLH